MLLVLAVELLQSCLAVAWSDGSGDHGGTTEDLTDDDLRLSYENLVQIARLPLHCYHTEYPNKLSQVLQSESELMPPSELHPIFYGCFDWHSSVHGHWMLARAAQMFPNTDLALNVTSVFTAQFTLDKVSKELSYFNRESANSFERTYGWAWLLKLQEELLKLNTDWSDTLHPLVQHIVTIWTAFLPNLLYPVRVGEHANTAFGLSFAIDFARNVDGNEDFEKLIVQNSTLFYQTDKSCPLGYEPSGYDFLSPCLEEVDLMVKVLTSDEEFSRWLLQFSPQLLDPEFDLQPGEVVDEADGKLVHLVGLNLSRGWCLYNIANRLVPIDAPAAARLLKIGDNHVRASKDKVMDSDYAGSHWLASFLLLALQARAETDAALSQAT